MRSRRTRIRLARITGAAVVALALVTVPGSVQAQSPTCPGTGTDGAVNSPIEIDTSIACPATTPTLAIHYLPSVDGVVSLDDKSPTGGAPSDHDDLRFTPGGGTSYVMYGGSRYNLLNVHYHGEAEHKFAGQPFAPVEAHLVHELDGAAKGYVVLSVLVDSSNLGWTHHDELLLDPPTAVGTSKNVYAIDLQDLLPVNRTYYRYTGSLTTPDAGHVYYKPVNWIVFNEHSTANPNNVNDFRALWGSGGNKRLLQSNTPAPNIHVH